MGQENDKKINEEKQSELHKKQSEKLSLGKSTHKQHKSIKFKEEKKAETQ